MPSKLLRASQAGPLVGVSGETLRAWIRAGLIKPTFITPGGQYRFDPDDLQRQVAEGGFTAWTLSEHR